MSLACHKDVTAEHIVLVIAMSGTPMLINHNCKEADNKEAEQAGLERLLSVLLHREALQRQTNEVLQILQ